MSTIIFTTHTFRNALYEPVEIEITPSMLEAMEILQENDIDSSDLYQQLREKLRDYL